MNVGAFACYTPKGAVMSNKSLESKMGNVKTTSQATAVGGKSEGAQTETLTAEELRRRRQAYFDR